MFNIHDEFWIFTHLINKLIYLLASKYILISGFAAFRRNFFQISGVYFDITFSITNQSHFQPSNPVFFPNDIRSLCHFNWKLNGVNLGKIIILELISLLILLWGLILRFALILGQIFFIIFHFLLVNLGFAMTIKFYSILKAFAINYI